jgi:hypothetical protein
VKICKRENVEPTYFGITPTSADCREEGRSTSHGEVETLVVAGAGVIPATAELIVVMHRRNER